MSAKGLSQSSWGDSLLLLLQLKIDRIFDPLFLNRALTPMTSAGIGRLPGSEDELAPSH